MMKFNINGIKNGMVSAPPVCFIYSFAAFIVVVLFRFVYPDFEETERLLDVFWFKARFARGISTYIDMFPAIFMSSLVLPFALKIYTKTAEKRFSVMFFESLKLNLLCCVAGTVVYTLLFLIAGPVLRNYQMKIQDESRLYHVSRDKASAFASEEKWIEALGFIIICKKIWPENQSLDVMYEKIIAGVEKLRYGHKPLTKNNTGLSQGGAPLNVNDALLLAGKALNEERYYDAHWFANIAERLARTGSTEAAQAMRTASLAWNAISRLEPVHDEKILFPIYKRKRDGYEALLSGELLRAYYIFNSLIKEAPADPDIKKYLALSEQELRSIAFFLDEMNKLSNGNVKDGMVFSVPGGDNTARVVIRIDALTMFEDAAFGRGLEAIGFSEFNEPVFRVYSEVVKILPIMINGEWLTILLLRAVDREDPDIKLEPVWTAGNEGARILLNIPFEELTLAADARQSMSGFFLRDLWTAADTLGRDGYVAQVFSAQIIRILAEPFFFLALSVFVLTIGWKYRAKFRARYSLYPMMIVLPLVFYLLCVLLRKIFDSIAVWSVISLGMGTSIFVIFSAAIIIFTIILFLLAAQRGDK